MSALEWELMSDAKKTGFLIAWAYLNETIKFFVLNTQNIVSYI